MEIREFIYYSSIVIWMVPVIRQFKTNLFLLFVLLGIMDPLAIVIYKFLGMNFYPVSTYTIFNLLIFIYLCRKLSCSWIIQLIASLITIFLLIIFSQIPNYSLIFILFAILGLLITNFTKQLFIEEKFQIFNFIIICYFVFGLVNQIMVFIPSVHGEAYFYLSVVFQYIFALFFILFRENSPRLQIKLKTVEDKLSDEFNSPNF